MDASLRPRRLCGAPSARVARALATAYTTAVDAGLDGIAIEVSDLASKLCLDLTTAETAEVETLGLSKREVEVLRLIAAGRSNPDIAGELFIGVRTVRAHVSAIMRKLECTTRGEAAAAAFAVGLT